MHVPSLSVWKHQTVQFRKRVNIRPMPTARILCAEIRVIAQRNLISFIKSVGFYHCPSLSPGVCEQLNPSGSRVQFFSKTRNPLSKRNPKIEKTP